MFVQNVCLQYHQTLFVFLLKRVYKFYRALFLFSNHHVPLYICPGILAHEQLGLPANTKDYTYVQNEKYIKPVYYTTRKGTIGKRKATNYMPNQYWDFNISGKENAEKYLKMCAEENKRPKFYKFLDDNGDGSYSLKKDGSTDGYWKLLIDFKMYDNDGKGSKQTAVKPDFNMEECHKMLDEYQGEHQKFPVDQEVVDKFVSNYVKKHGERGFKDAAKSEAKAPTTKYDVAFSSDDLKYYSGSKGSEDLHDTPESLKPESEREWSTFNRQFSNKTNRLKNGEVSDITINTGFAQYFVVADGYMSGTIISKVSIEEYEEMGETIDDYIASKKVGVLDDRQRNRKGNDYNGFDSFENEARDTIDDELDKFLENHSKSKTSVETSRDNYKAKIKEAWIKKSKQGGSYSSDDLSALQKELYERHKNGEITNEEYLEETDELWGKANETYGIIPEGENAKATLTLQENKLNAKRLPIL